VIGAKSLGMIMLLVLAGVLAHAGGVLSPGTLVRLEPATAFWVVLFAVAFGTSIYRFWRLGEPSAHYFRVAWSGLDWEGETHFVGGAQARVLVGENRGEAFDLPPLMHRLMLIALAFFIGVATIDHRGLTMLARISQRLSLSSAEFCPDEASEEPVASGETDVPGCALIRRAYELGYAKSLGDCEKKKSAAPTAVCHLRQRDEPMLHYAFRLLEGFYRTAATRADSEALLAVQKELEHKVDHLEVLYEAQRQVMTVTPRSSHHLFTNLPKPPGPLVSGPEGCLERYRILPHRPPHPEGDEDEATRESRVLEHVIAKLLFETRYMPSAGHCPEFVVHWGAPIDSCTRLAKDPLRFLGEIGALEHVQGALGRKSLARAAEAVIAGTAAGQGGVMAHRTVRDLPAQRFLSFQCYIDEERAAAEALEHRVELAGESLTVRELRVPRAGADPHGLYVDRYQRVARLLARDFRYDALLSEAGIDAQLSDTIERSYSGGDFALARLDYLASVDVFATGGWSSKREDLLDVYPYYLHLSNFVSLFRRSYERERGRL
jgi:hypothetical protein